jgi:hypothetical protein
MPAIESSTSPSECNLGGGDEALDEDPGIRVRLDP